MYSKEELIKLSDKELVMYAIHIAKTLHKSEDDIVYINSLPLFLFDFMNEYNDIYNEKLMEKFRAKNFSINGWLNEKQWEYLSSVLFDDKKDGRTGSDLTRFEIKSSAAYRLKAEYKTSRNTGLAHTENYHKVEHVVMKYSNNYRDVTVHVIRGSTLIPLFDCWAEMFKRKHGIDGHNKNWCFRKSLNKALIKQVSHPVLIIEDRRLVYPRMPLRAIA